MEENNNNNRGANISIDFKLPLWGLISAAGASFVLVAILYFSVEALKVAVIDLQVTVKAGNAALVTVASDNNMQNFRLASIEAEQARINDIIRNLKTIKKLQIDLLLLIC